MVCAHEESYVDKRKAFLGVRIVYCGEDLRG